MSWSGFKKAVSRATTTVMMSAGAIEKTDDKEFDEQERRFKTFESKVEKLHKEAKGYLDAVRAMTLAQQRIADTVDHFYEDGTQLGYAAIQYKEAAEKMDTKARTELDESFRKTVLEPLGKFASTFPEYNEAIKKRHKKLLDYDRTRSNVKSLVDKPSSDAAKLPRVEQEAQQAKEVYDQINQTLLDEIPRLIELRVPFLNPCFEALVKSQLAFNVQAYELLEGIRPKFENSGESGDQAEQILAQIRELAICAA